MVLLAVTTWEKLQIVPTQFWVNALMLIVGGILALILVRHAAHMNRYMIGFVLFLMMIVVCFQWIYERNEPSALTPLVNKVATFFPSKITYHN